jgi:hypothetical protein
MKKVVVYDYSSVPTIRLFTLSNARIRYIQGPFGSGKSTGCIMDLIRRAHEQTPSPLDGVRRTRWAVIRNTYKQLKDTTMKSFFDWFPPALYGEYRVSDHDYIITKFPGVRAEFLFRALDRPDHVKNLLSLELTGAWINEAREIKREIYDALDGRIDRYPAKRHGGATYAGTMMDSNPPEEESWLHVLAEKERPANVAVFMQPSGRDKAAENLPNLPVAYYDNLAVGKTPEFIRVYIDNQYGSLPKGKPVYTGAYNEELHLAKSDLLVTPHIDVVTGWDFALYPAVVFIQVHENKVKILGELTGEGMGLRRFVETMVTPYIRTHFPTNNIVGFGDPTGNNRSQNDETTCYMELEDAGYPYIKPSHTNSIMARINAVEYFLSSQALINGEPVFQLDPSCVNLRRGFNGAYFFTDLGVPEKNEASHPHDALQYAMLYVRQMLNQLRRQSMRDKIPKKVYRPATYAGY